MSPSADGVRLQIHVQPNARRSEIIGLHGNSLKIKIHAPPEDGKANAELCAFLAGVLGVAKRAVSVDSGATSRTKVVSVIGISVAEVVRLVGI